MALYQLNRPSIDKIINYCEDMGPGEKLEVYEFGTECDLVLHIYKDEDYDSDKELYNYVQIHTARNGEYVDDTDDIDVYSEDALRSELQRINLYEDFGTV